MLVTIPDILLPGDLGSSTISAKPTPADRRGMADATSRKTIWALCDQGVISAGNFVTNVILIRHLPAAQFGVFALLLNAMLFLNNIHASLVTYTMCIRGAQANEQSLGKVATGGIGATLGLAIVNLIALYAASSYVAERGLLLFVAAASVCWQIQESLRTVFVSRVSYERALGGDTISYLGQAALIERFCSFGTPGLPSVFLAISGTSLLGALLQAFQIQPTRINWKWLRSFGGEIWILGRWSVLAKLVAFFSLQAFPWALSYRYGLVAVAVFQSLFQLVALTNPILLSANNLIMASIAKDRHQGAPFLENARHYMLLSGGIAALYFAVLLVSGGRVMSLFYGRNATYLPSAPLLRIFVAAYALEFVSMFAGAILAGMEKTRPLFFQQVCGMLIAICVVLPLVIRLGLAAAVYGLLIVNATKALAGWYLVYTAMPGNPKPNGADFAMASF
jgi:O-antigen/teichoic acid export membrane protein